MQIFFHIPVEAKLFKSFNKSQFWLATLSEFYVLAQRVSEFDSAVLSNSSWKETKTH